MKNNLKTAAAALILAVTVSTSFAFDITSTPDLADVSTAAFTVMAGTYTADIGANTGVVSQDGVTANNTAYIDQTGSSNFAAIVQTGTTVNNTAAIFQTGTNNRAMINQH